MKIKNDLTILRSIPIILFITIFLFSSCKKEDLEDNPKEEETIHVPNEEMPPSTYEVSDNGEKWIKPENEYHLLGYGYDMAWTTPNPSGVRNKIFDVDRYIQDGAGQYMRLRSTEQSLIPITAVNGTDLMTSFRTQYNDLDDKSVFKKGWNHLFGIENFFASEYIYAANTFTVRTAILRFNLSTDRAQLEKYLNNEFKKDCETLSPEALVAKYGTHIMENIALGIKLDFIYQAKTINPDREKAALQGMNNTYWRIFNNLPAEYDSTAVPENYAERTYYRSWGGDPSKAMYGLVSNKYGFKKEDIVSWQATINDNNVALVDFISDRALTPIYELIISSTKKEAVQRYIDNEYLQ
jgi:hypothetical protein